MCNALEELFADRLKEREMAGLKKGATVKLIRQVMRKIQKGQSVPQIAEDLLEPIAMIQNIHDLIMQNPGCDADTVFDKAGDTLD